MQRGKGVISAARNQWLSTGYGQRWGAQPAPPRFGFTHFAAEEVPGCSGLLPSNRRVTASHESLEEQKQRKGKGQTWRVAAARDMCDINEPFYAEIHKFHGGNELNEVERIA